MIILRCTCGYALRRTQPRPGTTVWRCPNPLHGHAEPAESEVRGEARQPQVWCARCAATIIDPAIDTVCEDCREAEGEAFQIRHAAQGGARA